MLSHPLLHLQNRATCSWQQHHHCLQSRTWLCCTAQQPLLHWKMSALSSRASSVSSSVISLASLQASFPSRQPWHRQPEWHGQGSTLSITLFTPAAELSLFNYLPRPSLCHTSPQMLFTPINTLSHEMEAHIWGII